MPGRNATYPQGDDPGRDFIAVAPSDVADLPEHRRLWIADAGDLAIQNFQGETVPMGTLPAGIEVPGRVKRVMATGTTATVARIV
jgi:hypothetical protein